MSPFRHLVTEYVNICWASKWPLSDLKVIQLFVVGAAGGDVVGLDIGVGASCIYPLLAAKKFEWKMLGTEIDEENAEIAIKNVANNGLKQHIKILRVEEKNDFFDVILENEEIFSQGHFLTKFRIFIISCTVNSSRRLIVTFSDPELQNDFG